ncbi:hypothetical protein [Clostridium sp. CTA-1]
MKITIICFYLGIIFLILLMKARSTGSILGIRAATILYVIGAGYYLGVFSYSISIDIKELFASSNLNKTEEQSLPINRAQNVGTIFGTLSPEVKLKFVQPKVLNPISANVLAPPTVKSSPIESEDEHSDNNAKIIGDKNSKIYHVPVSIYYNKEIENLNNDEYFNNTRG